MIDNRKLKTSQVISEFESDYNEILIIPEVTDEEIIRKIKIYDYDGSYYFRKIGFNRKINDEGR